MNAENFTKVRLEVFRILSERTPNTEQLELLQLARHFEPKDRHLARAAFKRYANPERAFEDEGQTDDLDLNINTGLAVMAIFCDLQLNIGFDIADHEQPLMDLARAYLAEDGIMLAPEGYD